MLLPKCGVLKNTMPLVAAARVLRGLEKERSSSDMESIS
jgi:hypothetical protein